MAFFSIIIPVYNTQDYIARCLDSCINQTFSDIEIIVIDDCGSDLAMDIVEKYSQKDKRIRIVKNIQNLGLFHTRITGEKQANGEYIMHLDSDDFICKDLCMKIFEKLSIDMEYMGGGVIDILDFGSEIVPTPSILTEKFFITPYLQKQNIGDMIAYFSCGWNIWGRVYHKELIKKTNQYIEKNLDIQSKINMGEDVLKFFVISMFIRTRTFLAEYLYFYSKNPNSITKNHSYLHIQKVINDYILITQNLEKIVLEKTSRFYALREQIKEHCAIAIAMYSYLSLKSSYQEGLLFYCFDFIKKIKFIKPQGKKRLIVFSIRFFVKILTFGKRGF